MFFLSLSPQESLLMVSVPSSPATAAISPAPRHSHPIVTRIAPPRGLFNLRLAELWAYRELLYFFVWRDVKIRYKQTAIGVLWVILQPLLTMLVFTLFFGRLAKLPSEGLPYPVFYFAALVPGCTSITPCRTPPTSSWKISA